MGLLYLPETIELEENSKQFRSQLIFEQNLIIEEGKCGVVHRQRYMPRGNLRTETTKLSDLTCTDAI